MTCLRTECSSLMSGQLKSNNLPERAGVAPAVSPIANLRAYRDARHPTPDTSRIAT